tara:strand:- start:3617 stop:3862 length:246 start_codon:yes stop_codon:yes gene_type:complete
MLQSYANLCIFVKKVEMKKNKIVNFIQVYYPVLLAFICLLYSVSLGLFGYTEEAQYSAHWPATILLFAIAIRQRRNDIKKQ